MFLNHCECPRCDYAWSDTWSCQVDDDCPNCGMRHISPTSSEDAEECETRVASNGGAMNTISEAAEAAAHAMAQVIQKATNTKTGDTAGVFFSGPEMGILEQMAGRLLKLHEGWEPEAD